MSKIDNGGPAFPKAGHEWEQGQWVPAQADDGMSLRDYFAAAALQGMLAENGGGTKNNTELAAVAYSVADAMLAVRGQKQPARKPRSAA